MWIQNADVCVCGFDVEISVAEMWGKEWNEKRGVNPTLMRL